MTSYVVLLRAVNVGGRNRIPMGELRAMCDELGLTGARTLLQSGNLVVAASLAADRLAATLRAQTLQRFSLDVEYIVRSATEWARMIAANPFAEAARDDPAHLVVMCCTDEPGAAAVTALQASIAGRERVQAAGRDVFIVYPDGIGDSRVTNALIEKRLATRGTARNWNTVGKLALLCGAC